MNRSLKNRIVSALVTASLGLSLLALPVSASASGQTEDLAAAVLRTGNALSGNLPSHLEAPLTVGRKEAARRLSYLGISEGCGAAGLTELSSPCTVSDLTIVTARLSGGKVANFEEALAYLASLRRLTLTVARQPDGAVTADVAAVYFLSALGYEITDSLLSRLSALVACRSIGLWEDAARKLTAGDLALFAFRVLQTTDESGQLLSQILLSGDVLSYSDVVYLLWSDSQLRTDEYIWAMGYEPEGPAEGYYTVSAAAAPGMCLNALMSAINTDSDGVGVTVWEATDDVSQTFRLERTESGTYRLYCAASRGGYNRFLGLNQKGTLALYRASSAYAREFYIRSAGGGAWYLVDAEDPLRCLGASDLTVNGAAVSLSDAGDPSLQQKWILTRQGAVNSDGVEVALYPSNVLRITQKAYENFSHGEQNAIDITTAGNRAFAPFTATVMRIYTSYASCNAVWLQSNEPVQYADGSVDYMTLIFMHDNYVRDLSVGQVLLQGQYFYDMGTAGNSAGSHIHVAVIRGKYSSKMKLTGSGDVYADDAFTLLPDTEILDACGLSFPSLEA